MMLRRILATLIVAACIVVAYYEFAIVHVGVGSYDLEISLLNRDDNVKSVSYSLIQNHQTATVVDHYPDTEATFKNVDGNSIVLSITDSEKTSPLLRRQIHRSCATDTVLLRIEYANGRVNFSPVTGWFPHQRIIEVDISANRIGSAKPNDDSMSG